MQIDDDDDDDDDNDNEEYEEYEYDHWRQENAIECIYPFFCRYNDFPFDSFAWSPPKLIDRLLARLGNG